MMDQATEAKVIDVLGHWLAGRTLVLSTHRLQLLAWVDRIALMEDGQILLEGPRDDMLKKLSTGVSKKSTQPRQPRAATSAHTETVAPTASVTPSTV
jgi:ATP-binding cassette subfamily C protein LapB